MKYMSKSILTLFLFLLIASCIFSLFSSYKVCLEYFIQTINQKQYSEQIFGLITYNKFRLLQTILVLIIIFISFLIYYFKTIYNFIDTDIRDLFISSI